MHVKDETKNCYDGNLWSDKLCPDGPTCGKNCVIEGAYYQHTLVVDASGDGVTLTFVTHGWCSTNVGMGLYVLQERKSRQIEKVFMFSVYARTCRAARTVCSTLCKGPARRDFVVYGHRASAKYGTGYCGAQYPSDLKFINGIPNRLSSTERPRFGEAKRTMSSM
jgi:cellulose 1,4-beta-cellobiosidase